MPKQKTHKGLAKVCTVRNSGSIKIGVAGANHKTGKKSTQQMRKEKEVVLQTQI